MLKMQLWQKKLGIDYREALSSPRILIASAVVGLFLGGMLTGLLLEGMVLGRFGHYIVASVVVGLAMLLLVVLRQDELAAVVLIAVHLIVDWYLALYIFGAVLTLILLVVYFFARSAHHPWQEPRALWLWGLLLVLALFPAIRGATNFYDEVFYYPNIFVGALLTFWLGTTIARDPVCIRRLYKMLAAFGTFIALHTIVEALTGVFLFETAHYQAYLALVSNFQIGNSFRSGSFLENPDWNSTFLAMTLFLPLSLFSESTSFSAKLLYFAEICAILLALVFTYGIGAAVALIAGLAAFMVLGRRVKLWLQIILFTACAGAVLIIGFPQQVKLLLQHGSDPNELLLRSGAWQTAIHVIQAFPITGIGLSQEGYLSLSNIYRVAAQYRPLSHPHNSYLELGAMAGLPVLIVFVGLIMFALWLAWQNWRKADTHTRFLISGGMATTIVLTVNSVSINGWTLPPLAALGWLILGVISSPLLTRSLRSESAEGKAGQAFSSEERADYPATGGRKAQHGIPL